MTVPPASAPASGRLSLLLAIAIFGAANAVTRKLTEIGAENLVDGRNPISFCNVLFVGNVCALLLVSVLYARQWRLSVWQQLSRRDWIALTAVAVLGAALVPTLVFTALDLTAVNNVILIGQIDTPIVLVLSVLLLGERVNRWVVSGAALAFVGVALTVLLASPGEDGIAMAGIEIGRGEVLVAIAAVFKAISNLISKVSLQQIPLSVFNEFRLAVGTVVFFIAVIVLYGPSHFTDVASPLLWQWMVLYSAVIVVGGQLLWFNGLKRSTASEVSLATAFNPLAGILAAFLILGEVPTRAQYIGGAVILLGITLNQIGVARQNARPKTEPPAANELSDRIGFKGI